MLDPVTGIYAISLAMAPLMNDLRNFNVLGDAEVWTAALLEKWS